MLAAIDEYRPNPAICGYLAFTAALMLAVIAAQRSVTYSTAIVGLLATSLPALGAWLYIDTSRWEGPDPAGRIVRWAAIAIAVACSYTGFVLTVWTFSRLAAFLVLLQAPSWYLAIAGLSFLLDDDYPKSSG